MKWEREIKMQKKEIEKQESFYSGRLFKGEKPPHKVHFLY